MHGETLKNVVRMFTFQFQRNRASTAHTGNQKIQVTAT